MSDETYRNHDEANKHAKNFELKTTLGGMFEVVAEGRQQSDSIWKDGRSEYVLTDMYDLMIDLSGNDGKRIGEVTVKLPGLTIELGIGWIAAKTDYGWKTYMEYDSPKTWVKNVIKEES